MRAKASFLLCVLCHIVVFTTVVSNASFQNYKVVRTYVTSTVSSSDESWSTPGRVVNRMKIDGEDVVFRVVNGKPAKLGELPYQISLRKQVKKTEWFANFCGATILTTMELLSAGHCFRYPNAFDSCCSNSGHADKKMFNTVWAVAGTLDSMTHFHGDNDSARYGQWRKIRNVRYPTNYNFPKHDIAIIFLTQPLIFSDVVKPMPYATVYNDYEGTCLTSGYGRTAGEHRSTRLLKANLRMLNAKTCDRIQNQDTSRMLCTSDEISDTGKGDSGGPLVCKNTGDPMEADPIIGILVGIVSGKKRGIKDGSFFTRVSSYKTYIEDTIKEDASHPKLSLPCAVLVNFLHWIL